MTDLNLDELRRLVEQLQAVGDLTVNPPPVWLVRDLMTAFHALLDEVERLRRERAGVAAALSEIGFPPDMPGGGDCAAEAKCAAKNRNQLCEIIDAKQAECGTLRARAAELEAALLGLDAAVAESAPLAWAAAGDQTEAHAWEQRTEGIRAQAARALEDDDE